MAGEVSLQEYSAGYLVQRGFDVFDAALGPKVKTALRTSYPDEPDSPAALQERDDLKVRMEAWMEEEKRAKEDQETAERAVKEAPKRERSDWKEKERKATKTLEELKNRKPEEPHKVEKWLERARSSFSRDMKEHVSGEGPWDTHTIVQVMKAELEHCIAPHFGIEEPLLAKELLSVLLRVLGGRTWRAHARDTGHGVPTESESLDLLSALAKVLGACTLSAEEKRVAGLLEQAQALVQAARERLGREDAPALCSVQIGLAHKETLVLFSGLCDFERRLYQMAGAFEYQNGTIAFGRRAEAWPSAAKEAIEKDPSLGVVTAARHSVFHRTSDSPDTTAALAAMELVLRQLDGIIPGHDECHAPAHAAWPWKWPFGGTEGRVDVRLALAGGMRIPAVKERCLVGRSELIDTVVAKLQKSSPACVLLHGPPGVGKDVVAAEVARSSLLCEDTDLELQAWLLASTDTMLRDQLLHLFHTQRPSVFGSDETQEEKLLAIRKWLEKHSNWFLVIEDATWESESLWKYVPEGRGKLLVTSQVRLCTDGTGRGLVGADAIEVPVLDVKDSIELLLLMNLFQVPPELLAHADAEKLLQSACKSSGGRVLYIPPQDGENSNGRKNRHRDLHLRLIHDRELIHNEELRTFLTDSLGNLPLSVALCGQMLRSLGSVKELIEQFLAMPLEDVDKKGRNPITDRHYLGLKRSVLMAYQRLRESGEEEALADAEALLVALSLLPSSTVPTTLFVSDNPRHVVMPFRPGQQCRGRDSAPSFYRARELLVRHGLAKEAADPSHAAITHQLVQRVVRQHLLRDSRLVEVRGVLHERLVLARNLSDDADLRSVLPCVEWWCQEGKATDVERGVEELRLQIDMADAQLCQGRYEVAIGWQRHAQGRLDEHFPAENRLRCRATVEQGICLLHGYDPTSALCLFDTALLYIPEGDPLRTIALNCRAACLDKLGRHEEAVEEHRRVLGLRIRMDEPPHAVATSMNNLASALYKCGDASRRPVTLVLQREVLCIRRACLPAGHMDIGAALCQIANTYKQLKQPREAIPREEEALDIFRAKLGPHHEYIARVLANLSQSFEEDGQFAKARDVAKEALSILPEGHLDSINARMKLGLALGKLGDSSGQKRHFRRAVHLLRIANPPQPLTLANALCDLAAAIGDRPTVESLRLLQEALCVRKSALARGDRRIIELESLVTMATFVLSQRRPG